MKWSARWKMLASGCAVGLLMAGTTAVALDDWHKGSVDAKGMTIPVPPDAHKVWQPTESKEAPKAYPSMIVSHHDKWTRHGMLTYCGTVGGGFRYAAGPVAPKTRYEDSFVTRQDFDVDGDGDMKDDFIYSIPFSMEVPFGIPQWPYSATFPQRMNADFYGGLSVYAANTQPNPRVIVEIGFNPSHSPPWLDPRAEDYPLQAQPDNKNSQSAIRFYYVFVWKKEGFLNCPAGSKVTFDDNSWLSSLCTRGYWVGWDESRMIVQDGEKLYVSDTSFYHPWTGNTYEPYNGRLFLCYPTKVTWAEYTPKEHILHFNKEGAKFEKRNFKDVRAVGWYIGKDRLTIGEQAHCKWYGFSASAVVNRPAQPSANIATAKVPGDGNVPEFSMTTCEIPYDLWRTIHKYGDAPFHSKSPRYSYNKNARMGSTDYGNERHGHDEPATGLDLYETLAWLNTLSEYEGKTPSYYLDEACTKIFRNDHIETRTTGEGDLQHKRGAKLRPVVLPKIYVKWEADGWRLPTVAEWSKAYKDATVSKGTGAKGTAPVASGKPNGFGLYDMAGNVWELVWNWGTVYDPAKEQSLLTLGGDFNSPDDPRSHSASPYGDMPYEGSYNIGFRAVCRASGLKAPATADKPAANIPVWQIAKGEKTQGIAAPKTTKSPVEMVAIPGGKFKRMSDDVTISVKSFHAGKFPVTYRQWKAVCDWGEANGYSFGRKGDMGSMYFFNFEHSPEEPVTKMPWHEAIVWCNALSEMEGRKPFYYLDQEMTKPYRQAFVFNPVDRDEDFYLKVWTKENPHPSDKYGIQPEDAEPRVYEKWDVDGYRLPTCAEYEYALRGSSEDPYSWGKDAAKQNDSIWSIENGGGRTHPVGLKAANRWGLYDMNGNVDIWMNSSWDGLKTSGRPEHLDVTDPKWSRYRSKRGFENVYVGGQSWIWGNPRLGDSIGIFPLHTRVSLAFSDWGFRVFRCEAGTHPVDGLEPLLEPKALTFDVKDYNRLEN